MRRSWGLAPTVLSLALAACSQGGSAPGGGAGAAGTGTAGTGTSAGGTTGAAGSATAGSAGTALDAGGSDAAVIVDARVEAGDTPKDATVSACPPGAVICDDFEKYPAGATNLSPDWIAYTYSGTVRVDATRPRGGQQSLHLTTQAGMRHYADIIRETRGQELLPRKHYGRLMVWLTTIPPSAHWNLNMSSGPMAGAPDELAKFFEGGMFGKLMSNYAQRGRVVKNGEYLLRGGGPEAGDPGADADCAVAAPAQKVAAGKWICWEWEFDGTADAAHLWVDGQPMTEVDAIGSGKQCQGPGFMGRPMMPTYRWEGPQVFDKLLIGWEQYQDTPAQEAWIDDVVVGAERIGCPAP